MERDQFAKTKIIATLGPASSDPDVLKSMVAAGLDVVRINSAHGTLEEHRKLIETSRMVETFVGRPLSVLYDIAGPKIRVGDLPENGVLLEMGQSVTLTQEPGAHAGELQVECPGFIDMIDPGMRVFINDGAVQLVVKSVSAAGVVAQVRTGGRVLSRKGVNLPDTEINLPALSAEDKSRVRFGLKEEVDWFALSFVRHADNLTEMLEIMDEVGHRRPVIAKIETLRAVHEIDNIVKSFDGCMVARGDLGVELPIENVPHLQKQIIHKCNQAGKPVITATQMLESMVQSKRPTRAEAADVANAIYDGTDCVMLSGETAVGSYPVVAVDVMNSIILATEREIDYSQQQRNFGAVKSIADSVSHAVFQAAIHVRARAIVTMTHTGSTAQMVSKYRPPVPIYALTPFQHIQRQLNLVWGVNPLLITSSGTTDEMFSMAEARLLEFGVVERGDRVVLSAGVPIGVPGTTNLLKVQVVGQESSAL